MASDNYREFSVVLRLRTGSPSSLTTYEIIMEIKKRLSKYEGIFNIAVSLPNFILHLKTLEQQLDVLSWKQLTGPQYTLDILPWTSEYISFQLPWVIGSNTEESSLMAPKIEIDLPQQLPEIMPLPDFSYLMILELKEFYYSKLHEFLKCEETCRLLYELAQPFARDLEPRIENIYKQSERYSSIPPPDILSAVANFGASLNYQQLFVDEEIFGLNMTMQSIYQYQKEPACLNMYQIEQPNGKLMSPTECQETLKATFEAVLKALYPATEVTTTHLECDEYIYTDICSNAFSYRYKLLKPATQSQAQAISHYRFLKNITNVLGYSIVDHNWCTLHETVCQIKHFTHLISDFQYCVNDIMRMISAVAKNVSRMYQNLLGEVPSEKIPHICANVDSLISLIEDYNRAAHHVSNTFNENKKRFRSIKLASQYSPKSDAP